MRTVALTPLPTSSMSSYASAAMGNSRSGSAPRAGDGGGTGEAMSTHVRCPIQLNADTTGTPTTVHPPLLYALDVRRPCCLCHTPATFATLLE
jgi:hypothetical protein